MISVDTEGDDQWDTSHPITTKNAAAVPRFQELCEAYGLKPVWLTDWEMAEDDNFVKFASRKQAQGLCEVGMHLHSWTTPPEYELQRKTDAREYLIECPIKIMEAKIASITEKLTQTFGEAPVSHRSGRWAMDNRYFDLLVKYGYKVDCSVTPLVDWTDTLGATGAGGSDYKNANMHPSFIRKGLLEVPVTIRKLHYIQNGKIKGPYSWAREMRNWVLGVNQWLRPFDLKSGKGMELLLCKMAAANEDVLFTLHSSELMPGTNQIFRTKEDIDKLFVIMESVFSLATDLGYQGCTMREYYSAYEQSSK